MICVDSNVAVKWVLPEEHSEHALALFADAAQTNEPVVAPPLLPSEVVNTFRQRMRRDNPISLAEAVQLLERFSTFRVLLHAPEELYQSALRIATQYNLPAVYDAQYIALAQLLGCEFWTADQRLVNALERRVAFVHWLGEYRGPSGP